MSQDLSENPEYRNTMERLEAIKKTTDDGVEYWMAREIHPILGYQVWDKFEPVIERAAESLRNNNVDPSHHIARTSKMMEVGRGAQRKGLDYFLTRGACSLIAMNGDPSKPEIAGAQAYFAVQTRRMELEDQRAADQNRLDMRNKVTDSFKRVSGVAQDAGVVRQDLFHDARYRGLYGMPLRDVKRKKGVVEKENVLDRAGAMELSANDFQMNLAAEVIATKGIKGEGAAISLNQRIGDQVRQTMKREGAPLPENLPVEPPISEVRKRLAHEAKTALAEPKDDEAAT
jgi:DNA-damage-inducible protein D